MKKILKIIKWIPIALASVAVVFAIVFIIYTSKYYRTDKETVDSIESRLDEKVNAYSDDNGMVFIPKNRDYKAVIRMPENLAFLRINAVDVITKGYEEETGSAKDLDWYLAGHSLGGVAASLFLDEAGDDYKGLILCASYPDADFSDKDIRLLSIIGSKDEVVNKEAYERARAYWPEDSEEYIIEGGIHSYFGCYGIQKGDGEPTISNEEQIEQTVDIIEEWCLSP